MVLRMLMLGFSCLAFSACAQEDAPDEQEHFSDEDQQGDEDGGGDENGGDDYGGDGDGDEPGISCQKSCDMFVETCEETLVDCESKCDGSISVATCLMSAAIQCDLTAGEECFP